LQTRPSLPIHNMERRHHGLTKPMAESCNEAACVCLGRHHQAAAAFDLDRSGLRSQATARWQRCDARTRTAWANSNDATEAGALACALAAVELADGLVAVGRAETMTGADYYVAPPGNSLEDLEDCLRLEVSGVDRGPVATIARRLKTKLDQVARGHSNLPALAVVVGFRAQLIVMADLWLVDTN